MILALLLALNLGRVEATPCRTNVETGEVVCEASIYVPTPLAESEIHLCFSLEGDGLFVPCKQGSHLGEYVVRALIGRGVDITTTAISIEAGAVELNKIQPTVEHRVGISLLVMGYHIGGSILIERHWGYKVARWFSRINMFAQFAVGAWNLGQAWKVQRNSSLRSDR